ncbi:major facilitator superfamily domain-containing protein [Cryomyces antarcticus]|uniref:Major facilitator superfamily (MFS) profile domain-containing protein n=1 Tax=Cryomyces antarcticus TaxID=329879 RepID=A0ABR0M1S0_9PEZI
MPEHKENATETSPLLPKRGSSLQSVPPKPIESSDGRAPNGAIANGSLNEPFSLSSSSASIHSSDPEDGGDLERQSTTASAADRKRKAEGLPDVKKKMKYILPALAIGIFLSAADQTIIVSSYGRIGSELKALNNTSWIATAYFLTLTSFQPLYGKLSDIFTRKSCLLFAYLVFGLGCLFCGLARNMNELIAARAFAGIGGGGMTTVVSILLSDTVPLRERGKWQGYVNIIYATGAGVGAPLGGILADYIGWRWAFLFQAPLCLVAFLAVSLILKLPARDQSNWKAKLRRIDFLGAAILIAAVFTLLLGLDRGSNVSWRDKVTLIALCTSLPLFAIFVGVEMKVAAEPFAPGHIIFERTLFACYLCNFFSFCGWLAALFYIPLFFQAVDGLSATQAGVRLIPGIICGVSGSLFAGFYMQRTARYYWLTVIAYSCLVIGMTTIFLFSGIIANSTLGMITGMCVCGFSNGIGVTTSLIALIANSSHEDQAVATACSYLFRSLGSVFGVSLSATVANATLRSSLADALGSGTAAADIAARVRESLGYIGTLEPAVRDLVRQCYAKSTRAAFGLEIGLVAGAAVAAWFIRERALSR